MLCHLGTYMVARHENQIHVQITSSQLTKRAISYTKGFQLRGIYRKHTKEIYKLIYISETMCNSHKPVLNKRSMTHKCCKVSLNLSIHYSSVCIIGCSLTLLCQSQRQLGNAQRCAHIQVRHTFSLRVVALQVGHQ